MFGIKDFYWVLINSSVSFIFLFIISKILGKKQIAQLEFIDYVVGISLGSIAAEWAINVETPFYYYAVSMAIFFIMAYLVSLLGRKTPFAKKLFKGKPITLIYEGKIDFQNLCKSKIDVNDLLSLLREDGYFDINDVAYAIFETSGKLSILPKGNKRPVVIEDINKEAITQSSLSNIMVVDGKISKSGLNEINKDKEWLFNELNIKNKNELKNIILAIFDEENQKMNIHYKNK